ncbi:MAG: nucleotidyltransferase domain-containing protein [Anaerolineae bacterium]|nr:nucleotidyltransferase domain-containing protein [Anaerolineae bacterium]
MKRFGIKATRHLPDHDAVLDAILGFFYQTPGVIGCFLSGSTATGHMDVDSDLDLGVVFQNAGQRMEAWEKRWEWQIAPWFHRFDADHIKPHFVIYMFEPAIKADINLYLINELPSVAGGPYYIVWDETGALNEWVNTLPVREQSSPDWREAAHEDERFWAWLFYLYNHVHRGEYYHCAYEFPVLRDIIEKWTAGLAGHAHFGSRRLEDKAWADRLLAYDLFPKPDRGSLKACMVNAIEMQLELRREVTELDVVWRTEARAIAEISRLIEGL